MRDPCAEMSAGKNLSPISHRKTFLIGTFFLRVHNRNSDILKREARAYLNCSANRKHFELVEYHRLEDKRIKNGGYLMPLIWWKGEMEMSSLLPPVMMWPRELYRPDKSIRLQSGFFGWWNVKRSFVSLMQIPGKPTLRRHFYMDSLRGHRGEGGTERDGELYIQVGMH